MMDIERTKKIKNYGHQSLDMFYVKSSECHRLPHPRSGDSQGQETFLAPSADKQTRNYDTECSNHHPSLSTLRD